MKRALALLFLLSFLWGKVIETSHFYIYYPEGEEEQALRTAAYLEKYYPRLSALTGNFRGKTIIAIQNLGLLANGFTDPTVPSVHIFTGKPHPNHRFGAMRSWWRVVSVHELTHAFHLNQARGLSAFIRTFMGRAFLPNLIQPEFTIEGMAVYSESLLFPYEGRLNEGFYRRFLQTRKPWSLSRVMAEPLLWPYYSARYIYGGEFVEFLADRYGEESLTCLAREYSSSLSQFIGLSPAYHRCFGESLSSLFREFQKGFSGEREEPVFSRGEIRWLEPTPQGLVFSSWKVLLPFPNFPVFSPGIYLLSKGKVKKIIPHPSSLPIKFRNGKLYYTKDELQRGFPNKINQGYGVVREVVERELKTGRERILIKGEILSYEVKDTFLYFSKPWGCCGSRIYKMDLKTGRKEEIFASKEVEFYSLARGDFLYAAGRRDGEGGDIYIIQRGKARRLTHTPYTETDLRWQGHLLFSSNAGGTWRAYSYRQGKFYLLNRKYCAFPVVDGDYLFCEDLTQNGIGIFRRKVQKEESLPGKGWEEEKIRTPEFKRKSHGPNFLTLLIPDLMYPTLDQEEFYWNFIGHDALEENFYTLSLGENSTGNFVWKYDFTSLYFYPLVLSLHLSSEDSSVELGFPLRRSLRKWLREGDFYIWGWEEGKRRAIGFSLPVLLVSPSERLRFFLELGLEKEGKFSGSPLERTGRFFRTKFLWAPARKSGFYFSISGVKDKDNPTLHNFKTVSLGDLQARSGLLAYGEFSTRIANIRKGISIPHFFMDGVYFSLFGEGFFPDRKLSAGAFLSVEVSTYHGLLRFYPLAGVAYRIDQNRIFPFVGIGGLITPLSLLHRTQRGRNFSSKGLKYLKGGFPL